MQSEDFKLKTVPKPNGGAGGSGMPKPFADNPKRERTPRKALSTEAKKCFLDNSSKPAVYQNGDRQDMRPKQRMFDALGAGRARHQLLFCLVALNNFLQKNRMDAERTAVAYAAFSARTPMRVAYTPGLWWVSEDGEELSPTPAS